VLALHGLKAQKLLKYLLIKPGQSCTLLEKWESSLVEGYASAYVICAIFGALSKKMFQNHPAI